MVSGLASELGDSFGRENRPALDRLTRIALQNSPILRRHLRQHRDAYSDALQQYLEREATHATPAPPRRWCGHARPPAR